MTKLIGAVVAIIVIRTAVNAYILHSAVKACKAEFNS